MKLTQPISHTTDPAHRGTPVRSSAARSALWVLGPLAIAASFVQALRQGLCHGDWSAFSHCEPPPNDDDFSFFARTGRYS